MKKKSKKSKKNNKKIAIQKMRVILCFLILIVMAIFIFKGTSGETKLSKAMKTVDTYMSYINEAKYEEMYEMISESAKKNISKEDFITRNEEVYNLLEASSVSVSNMSEEEQENRKDKSYIYK